MATVRYISAYAKLARGISFGLCSVLYWNQGFGKPLTSFPDTVVYLCQKKPGICQAVDPVALLLASALVETSLDREISTDA